jgi:protein phosphatase
MEDAIEGAVRALSQRVFAESSALRAGAKMGATVTMGLFVPPRLYISHLGDSRAYLLRDGRLTRLTRDHSVVATLIKRGIITPDQAVGHPMRGQLTRYVGMGSEAKPDISLTKPKPGDVFLLCTDGLTNEVSEQRLAELILEAEGLSTACRSLVDEANRSGGRDNITAVLARVRA